MNRLFLTLLSSAALVASGCEDPCHWRTVSVGWPTFQLANGTVTSSCTTAGVSVVDVFLDDAQVGGNGTHFACTDGGVNVTGVSNDGAHRFTVEAIDSGSGAIALRDEVTLGSSGCSDVVLDTQPSEGTFELDFSFTPDLCTSATDSYIWFTLHDDIANQTIAVDASNTPQAWTCGSGTTTPVPISFALASGPYTLQRTEEVLYPGPAQQAGNCNSTGFDMAGATITHVNVGLTDGVSCF